MQKWSAATIIRQMIEAFLKQLNWILQLRTYYGRHFCCQAMLKSQAVKSISGGMKEKELTASL